MRCLALLPLLLHVSAQAQPAPIRIWGTPAMLGIAERWAAAYRRDHPDAHFEFAMKGSDSAIHGLTGNAADIAFMGRENDVVDDNGFSRPKGYAATRIEIANGSIAVPGKSDAIAVLVPADNPLRAITTEQLAAILGCGDRPKPIRTWGELGLQGIWAARPIRVHVYDFAMRTGRWMQDRIAKGDRRMCWDRLIEYGDERRLDGTVADAADRIGEAARRDPDALAIANAAQAVDGLRLVAVGEGASPPELPSAESIVARRYPLGRRAYAFVDRPPNVPLDRRVHDFLAFALSPAGQALLADDKGYLPLYPAVAAAQRAILEKEQ